MKRTILITIAVLTLPTVLLANSHPNLERGMVPGSMMRLSGPDNVNLFNGSLNLTVPLGGTYPVSDTLSYSFVLRYNSNIWDFNEWWDNTNGEVVVQAHPAFFSNAGLGWRLSLGELLPPGEPLVTGNPAYAWVYLAPDGSSHRFYSSLHRGEGPDDGLYTRDGSYLRLQFIAFDTTDDPIEIDLEMPSGNIHTFELKTGWDLWRLTEIKDQFGNSVTLSYVFSGGQEGGDLECTITDSTNYPERTHVLNFERYNHPYDNVPRYRLKDLALAAFGDGNQACYSFEYVEQEIPRSYKHDDPAMDDDVVVPLLQTATFPDGSSDPCDIGGCSDCSTTDFSYILTGDPAGLLETMRLPTGGVIDWQYTLYTFPQGNVSCDEQGEPWNHAIMGESTGVFRRRVIGDSAVPDGTWWYSPVDNFDYVLRSVTSPDGTRVDHYFNTGVELCAYEGDWRGWAYGLPFLPEDAVDSGGISKEVFAPDAGTSDPPIRRISVDYRHDQLPSYTSGVSPQSFHNTNRRLQSRETVYEDDVVGNVARSEQVQYSNFDGFGNYRQVNLYGNFEGEPSRVEFAGYNPAPGGTYYQYTVNGSTNELNGTFPDTGYPLNLPWILNTLDVKTTQIGYSPDPVEENRVEYCFDRSDNGDFLSPTTGFLNGLRIHIDEDPASDDRSPDDIIKKLTESSIAPGRVGRERLYGADTQTLPTDGTMSACDVGGLDPEYKITHQYASGVLKGSKIWEVGGPAPYDVVDILNRDIDPNTSLTVTETDTSGYSTYFNYDLLGRLTEAVPTDGAKTALTYTPASGSGVDLVKATAHQQTIDQDSPYPVLAESEFTFDAFGRGEKESHLLADGTWNQRISGYDAQDRLTWITEWQPEGTAPADYSKTINSDFDAFGRVGTVTLPDGHQILHTYTGRRLVDRTAWVGTNFDGVDTVDEEATTTTTTLDRKGRPIKVEEPSGANGLMIPTDYRYDVAGNLKWAGTTVLGNPDITQIREFSYNGLGFLESSSIPEKAVPTTFNGYDPMGNVGTVIDGAGDDEPSDLSYTYDFASRLKTIVDNTVGAGDDPVIGTFIYYGEDGIPDDRDGGTWSEGKLATATRFNLFDAGAPWDQVDVTESYEYDGIGGAVSRKQTDITLGTGATPVLFEQGWTYNDLGQVATTTYPEEVDAAGTLPDLVVTNGFSNGWLTSVTPGVEEMTYYANGMLELVKFHTYFAGSRLFGIAYDRDPDWMQRPREIRFIGGAYCKSAGSREEAAVGSDNSGKPGSSDLTYWESGVFGYDGSGNLTAQRGYLNRYTSWDTEVGNRYHEYDKVNRLKSLSTTTDHCCPELSYGAAFDYDAFGNLVSRTLNGDTYSYAVNTATNHLSGGVNYDTAGNQQGWGAYTYDYTPFHQIREYAESGRTQHYVYSADNERVVVYDSFDQEASIVLRDLDAKVLRALRLGTSGLQWERDYLYRGRTLVGAKIPEQYPYPEMDLRLFTDHLGSVRLVTHSSPYGDPVEFNEYTPFGSEWTSHVLGTEQKLRFTGHERDLMDPTHTTDDIDYMHARHYNLNLARFLSVDPVGGDPLRPQSWNGYAYVLNNPLRFTDPFGLSEADSKDCAGAGAGDTGCGRPGVLPAELEVTGFGGITAAGGAFLTAQVEAGIYGNSNDWGLYYLWGWGPGYGGAVGLTVGAVKGDEESMEGEYVEAAGSATAIGGSLFLDLEDTRSFLPEGLGFAVSPPSSSIGVGFFLTNNHSSRLSGPEVGDNVDKFLFDALTALTDPEQWGF